MLMLFLSAQNVLFAVDSFPLNSRANDAVVNSKSRSSDEKETLNFEAILSVTSGPLGTEKKDELIAWMNSKQCRNHFLSAGGSRKLSEDSLTPELEQLWKDACDVFYGVDCLPEKGDAVVVSETVIAFPGLMLENSVYSGIKLLKKGNFPAYQTVLIAEKQRVYGLAPVVWIFNQLTGNSAKKDDQFGPPSGKAKSMISIIEEKASFCVHFDCVVQVEVKFPKVLVKIMPMSKEKMEQQGSASVTKAVEKDVAKAVQSAIDAFLSWRTSLADVVESS